MSHVINPMTKVDATGLINVAPRDQGITIPFLVVLKGGQLYFPLLCFRYFPRKPIPVVWRRVFASCSSQGASFCFLFVTGEGGSSIALGRSVVFSGSKK
jgi:hypothetical protein